MNPAQEPARTLSPDVRPSMWDGFEHIVMFTLLYSVAISFSMLVHTFIDKWVPGISNTGSTSTFSYLATYWDSWSKALLRGYISTLIVSFPLFAGIYLDVQKRTRVFPILKTFKIRKFFIYLTLFTTFSIAVCNVGTILYTVISGNYTSNALLHFITTSGITGLIFLRFLFEVLEDRYPYV